MIFIKFECLVPGGLAHIVEIKLRDSDMNRDNIKEINENRIELEELVYLEELWNYEIERLRYKLS